jgi:hypothetical protein
MKKMTCKIHWTLRRVFSEYLQNLKVPFLCICGRDSTGTCSDYISLTIWPPKFVLWQEIERYLLHNQKSEVCCYVMLTASINIKLASCTMGTGGLFPGNKARPGRDADHSLPTSVEGVNV